MLKERRASALHGLKEFCPGGPLPSQKQLKWSQLKVGIMVVVASLTLATLIVLMSGGGMFTSQNHLKFLLPDASGLAEGAPVA